VLGLLLLMGSNSELLLIVFNVVIVHSSCCILLFKVSYSFFVQGHPFAPLGLGVLLSQCIGYFLLTDIYCCELVHLTINSYSNGRRDKRSELFS